MFWLFMTVLIIILSIYTLIKLTVDLFKWLCEYCLGAIVIVCMIAYFIGG